jgi:hypothetical protein
LFWRPNVRAVGDPSAGSVRYGKDSLFCAARFGANDVGCRSPMEGMLRLDVYRNRSFGCERRRCEG